MPLPESFEAWEMQFDDVNDDGNELANYAIQLLYCHTTHYDQVVATLEDLTLSVNDARERLFEIYESIPEYKTDFPDHIEQEYIGISKWNSTSSQPTVFDALSTHQSSKPYDYDDEIELSGIEKLLSEDPIVVIRRLKDGIRRKSLQALISLSNRPVNKLFKP